jgi:hypothetical protein
MMKLAILTATVAAASAFAPVQIRLSTPSMRSATGEAAADIPADIPQPPVVVPINGWVPDDSKPCYGLPGVVAPTGFFDPLGFAQRGITLNEIKRNRESEVMHGRVAMLATVGYLVGESFPGPFGLTGPANEQLAQVPAFPFTLLAGLIGAAELKRATIGWVEPDFGNWSNTLWKLRDGYYPGDLGFDPLGFRPSDPKKFADMQTKELQNGRLAMIGAAGMCAQEIFNHKSIFGTIEFYEKVSAGINPYE